MSHRKLSLDISKLSHNSTILEDFLVKSCVENLEVIVLSLTKLLCESVFFLFLDMAKISADRMDNVSLGQSGQKDRG